MKAPSWLRPSLLPRLAVCPAAGVESVGSPRIGGDAAAIGSAWHEVAEVWLTDDLEQARIYAPQAAHRWQVDASTLLDWLSRCAATGFPGKASRYVEVSVCLRVADVEINGRADVVLEHGDLVEVVDYKTGNPDFYDPGSLWQIEAYAVAAARSYGFKKARASLWYVQLGADGWISIDVDVEEAEARIEKVVERALRQVDLAPDAREYRVGEGCTFCPAAGTCPALAREVRPFLAVQGYEPQAITLDNFATFAAAVDRAGKIVEAAKDARKRFVVEHGGRVEADGQVWELRKVEMPASERKAYTMERLQRSKAK